ncbi:MAG: histidine phosphatase family protein [Proteobacteria bacterium]|nr:histidine phosphatase family protein [Pseudomonadota bacterium]
MEAPAVTRHRRPFLAPVWVTVLVAAAVAGGAFSFYRAAVTTLVVLVPVPDAQPAILTDPPLSAEGELRAQALARTFGTLRGGGGLDALYVSDERRAQQTAAPLAERLHRAPILFKAADAPAAAARLLREHRGGAVLVVGGGGSLAQMAHELADADGAGINGADADAVYLLSIPSVGSARLLRLTL